MSKFGGWNVDVLRDKFPQKIATAVAEFEGGEVLGAGYKAIAYLGTQEVNGINHAVLMEQTIFSGADTVNAVVVVFNEKPNSKDVVVSDIRRIVEAGGKLGGTKVHMTTEIPQEVKDVFNTVINGFTGSTVKPFVYVGEKQVKGTDYKLIAEVKPVVPNAKTHLSIVTVNGMENTINFENVFERATAEEWAINARK